MNLKIEKNVPMPEFRGEIVSIISKMEIGDSIPGLRSTQIVYCQQLLRNMGRKGSARQENNQNSYRLWRVK